MNKEQIRDEIAELEKRVCELKEELEDLKEKEVKKGKIWKPKCNEKYWAYCYDLQDVAFDEYGTALDEEDGKKEDDLIDRGLVYPTEKKAEFEANREKYTRLFRQYVEQHSEPLDWENDDQEKLCVCYNYKTQEILYQKDYRLKTAFTIYASSKEVLQEAIDFVGEDNFKKYILGI